MIHFNKTVASSAVYSIEEYNFEIAKKRKNHLANNIVLGAIIVFGCVGLYFSLIGG